MITTHECKAKPGAAGNDADDDADADDVPVVDISSRAVPQLLQSLESCAVRENLLEWSPGKMVCDEASGAWLVQLTKHRPVCRLEANMSLQHVLSMDTMQLLLALERAGWEWAALPATKKDRLALTYRPGDPKRFFAPSHTVCCQYLCCLLMADDLVGDTPGKVPSIPHWASKPAQVYSAILRGEPVQMQGPLQALTSDVHDDPPLPDCPRASTALHAVDVQGDGEVCRASEASGVDSEVLLQELQELIEQPSQPTADAEPVVGEDECVGDNGGDLLTCQVPAVVTDDLGEAAAEDAHNAVRIAGLSAFGPFRFSYKTPNTKAGRPFGGLEISCVFHRKNSQTSCKKYLQLRNASQEEQSAAVRALKGWALAYDKYSRQRDHLHHVCSQTMAPDADTIASAEVLLQDVRAPAGVKTDVELDAEQGVALAPKPNPKSKGRAKAKPKPKPKSKPVAKRKAASKSSSSVPEPAALSDEAASDPESVADGARTGAL